jgi:hypothetical protein
MRDLKELVKDLDKIQNKITNELIKAQQDTAKIVCEDVKVLAPKDTGEYANSIKVSETKVDGSKIETDIYTDFIVSSKSNGKSYNLGYLLENGYAPHFIFPVDASVLKFEIGGKTIFSKYVLHPGFVGSPHFAPALNKNKSEYDNQIGKALDKVFK